MTETFLREVRLKDFRTFGEFTLHIPPGPGLTLLVGTNGLGKSSFFDAIEWCLTGSVRRFEAHVGRLRESEYLTRRDAKPGSHQACLSFTKGPPLTRTMGESPAAQALVDLLKDPDWADIKDIGAYLGFTHFLGQASQQRFTSRDQSDQWQALKGPSGIDRLEAIRTSLRGRSTTHAFRRRVERQQMIVDDAILALQQWQGHVSKLAELQARGSASGAETEAALNARLSVVEQAFPEGGSRPTTFTERLSDARLAIETEQREIAQRRAGLGGLQAVVVRFSESSLLADHAGARIAAADQGVLAATTQVSETLLAASNAEQDAARQAEKLAREEMKLEEGVQFRAAIAEFGQIDTELQAAKAEEATLTLERDTSEVRLQAARTLHASALESQATLDRLDAENAKLQLWATRISALDAQEASARELRNSATTANTQAESARARLSELQRAYDNARDAEASANERVDIRRRESSQLAELLSGLAAHIQHDDTACPVCASPFAEGELQRRANEALAAQDARLADEVEALAVLRDQANVAAQDLAKAQAEILNASTSTKAADVAEAAAASERAAIQLGLGVIDGDPNALVTARSADNARERAAHIRDNGGSAVDVASAQARVGALATALGSLDERLSAANQRRSRCEMALQAIQDSLEPHPKPWSLEAADEAVAAQRKRTEEARAALEALRIARATSANAETAARERLAAAHEERDRVASAISEAEATRVKAIEDWLKAGMEADPSSPAIEARDAALVSRAGQLASYLEEATALSRSYEALLAQHELRSLRELMEAEGGPGAADDALPRTQKLQEQLEEARVAFRATAATRDAVVAYGDQLKTEAETFSTQFLLPLNDLIDAFNRALLSTPGETVQFNAEHTVERTALGMRLRYPDAIDNAQYKTTLPPQLVLSEGQMAANGFSILCAASTAYRWSRWRALLLDDPLQHNDIIHAAAFVDVMRNLVELEKYQLIMSSHKRDEGEFIARKFDAAGLPCTVVELIGASREGVRFAEPRPNVAASRLLAEPQARLA